MKKPIPDPAQRLLRTYAFDPSRGARVDNHITIAVPYEPVQKGPVGRKIAVLDYDATNKCYYEAVDLDAGAVVRQGGLAPSESSPQFHQQMVYAVVMDTIRRFETGLGREVKWRRDTGSADEPYHGKLKIYPHAMQEGNAFYDPDLRALLFGYFKASTDFVGANLPGQVVFTCLSHDIIVHETTHAILDGIREHFSEPTGPDAAAFHEGFADIVALMQHFSYKETLLDTIQRTGGLIHRRQLAPDVRPDQSGAMIQAEIGEDNPLVDLARQFGEAMGNRKALRSALGTPPDPRALERALEPHDRGAILVAAVFDAFFSVYSMRTRDLIRIAYPDGRSAVPNFVNPDLANRLAEEAARTAIRILNMCIQALDYCPPVDITFGDYLRAIVTADHDAVAEDGLGYRAAIVNAFRARGIRPEGVVSYGEESLLWDELPKPVNAETDRELRRLWWDLMLFEDDGGKQNEKQLYAGLWGQADERKPQFRLSDDPVQAKSIHSLHRLRPDGSMQRQMVAELVQKRNSLSIYPGDPKSPTFTFRGGTTVLIDRQGGVRFAISKPIDGPEGKDRLDRQRDYLQRAGEAFPLAPYVSFDPARDLGFRGIHRGY